MTKITLEVPDKYAEVISFTLLGRKDGDGHIIANCIKFDGNTTIKITEKRNGGCKYEVVKESDTA